MEKKHEMPHETFVELCREFDNAIRPIVSDFLENAKKKHKDIDSIAQSIAQPLMMHGTQIMLFSGMPQHELMVNFTRAFLCNEKFLEHEVKQKPHEFLIQVAVEHLLDLGFTREDIVEHVCKIHEEYVKDIPGRLPSS